MSSPRIQKGEILSEGNEHGDVAIGAPPAEDEQGQGDCADGDAGKMDKVGNSADGDGLDGSSGEREGGGGDGGFDNQEAVHRHDSLVTAASPLLAPIISGDHVAREDDGEGEGEGEGEGLASEGVAVVASPPPLYASVSNLGGQASFHPGAHPPPGISKPVVRKQLPPELSKSLSFGSSVEDGGEKGRGSTVSFRDDIGSPVASEMSMSLLSREPSVYIPAGVVEGIRDPYTTSLFGEYSLPLRDPSFNLSFMDGEELPRERRVKPFVKNTGMVSHAAFFAPPTQTLRCDMCASEGMRLVTYGRSEANLKEDYSVCRGCCRPLSVTINKMLASEQAKIARKARRVSRLQKEEAVQAALEKARQERIKKTAMLMSKNNELSKEEEEKAKREEIMSKSGEGKIKQVQKVIGSSRVLDTQLVSVKKSVTVQGGGKFPGEGSESPVSTEDEDTASAHGLMKKANHAMKRQESALKRKKQIQRDAVKQAFHLHADERGWYDDVQSMAPQSHGGHSLAEPSMGMVQPLSEQKDQMIDKAHMHILGVRHDVIELVVKNSHVLQTLSVAGKLEELLMTCGISKRNYGQLILEEGQPAVKFVCILEGFGTEYIGDDYIQHFQAGNVVGENFLLSGLPRESSLVCADKHIKYLEVTKEVLESLCEGDPALYKKVMTSKSSGAWLKAKKGITLGARLAKGMKEIRKMSEGGRESKDGGERGEGRGDGGGGGGGEGGVDGEEAGAEEEGGGAEQKQGGEEQNQSQDEDFTFEDADRSHHAASVWKKKKKEKKRSPALQLNSAPATSSASSPTSTSGGASLIHSTSDNTLQARRPASGSSRDFTDLNVRKSQLEGTSLRKSQLEGTSLRKGHSAGALHGGGGGGGSGDDDDAVPRTPQVLIKTGNGLWTKASTVTKRNESKVVWKSSTRGTKVPNPRKDALLQARPGSTSDIRQSRPGSSQATPQMRPVSAVEMRQSRPGSIAASPGAFRRVDPLQARAGMIRDTIITQSRASSISDLQSPISGPITPSDISRSRPQSGIAWHQQGLAPSHATASPMALSEAGNSSRELSSPDSSWLVNRGGVQGLQRKLSTASWSSQGMSSGAIQRKNSTLSSQGMPAHGGGSTASPTGRRVMERKKSGLLEEGSVIKAKVAGGEDDLANAKEKGAGAGRTWVLVHEDQQRKKKKPTFFWN